MDWQRIIEVLGGTAAVVAGIVWIARAAINHMFSRDLEKFKSGREAVLERELEQLRHEYQVSLEQARSVIQAESESEGRIKAEIIRWANPILGTVNSLDSRLGNILEPESKGYLALDKSFKHPSWSSSG